MRGYCNTLNILGAPLKTGVQKRATVALLSTKVE